MTSLPLPGPKTKVSPPVATRQVIIADATVQGIIALATVQLIIASVTVHHIIAGVSKRSLCFFYILGIWVI